MNDTTLSYPSMSQSPPAAASRNDGGDNPETLTYDPADTDVADFEAENFDQSTGPMWIASPEDRPRVRWPTSTPTGRSSVRPGTRVWAGAAAR